MAGERHGYIGGSPAHLRQLVDRYRAAGEKAGHAERLTGPAASAIGYDRVQAVVDWGGLPGELVRQSLDRLGTEIAPALRSA